MASPRSRAALLLQGRGRRGSGRRVFGLGDLPAGFTMGDPTTADYGSAYYQGHKIAGHGPYQGVDTWYLDDASGNQTLFGPPYDPAVEAEIDAMANAAYPQYRAAQLIASATPEMRAILTDPEWTGLSSTHPGGFTWNDLSAELQAKIEAVPNLEANIPGSPTFSAAAQSNPTPPPAAPTGPSVYTVNGLSVDASGNPLSYNDPNYYNALYDAFKQDQANGITPGVVSPSEAAMAKQNPLLVSSLPPNVLKTYGPALQAFLNPPPPATASTASSSAGAGGGSGGDASSAAPTTPPPIATGGGLNMPNTFTDPTTGLATPTAPTGTGDSVSLASLGGGTDWLLLGLAGVAAFLATRKK